MTKPVWTAFGEGGTLIGVSAATFTSGNAPSAISPQRWIKVVIDGVDGYLPWFSAGTPTGSSGGGGGGSSAPFTAETIYDADADANVTGAAIVGGIITLGTHIADDRSANVPNAAAIIAAAPVQTVGTSWLLLVRNEGAHTQEFYTNDSSIVGDDDAAFDWIMTPRKAIMGFVTITGANEVTIISLLSGYSRLNYWP